MVFIKNSQGRKWNIVINSPHECGMTHEVIKDILMRFAPDYYCLADEVATTGTLHTHIFIYSKSPIRFFTLKERFKSVAHLEKAYGSAKINREYITKGGRWRDTEKSETSVEGSFFEYGQLPDEKAEISPVNYQLIQDINEGKRTAEIVEETPSFVFKVKEIDVLRQALLTEHRGTEYRKLEVAYLFGASGTGKTRSIYERHKAADICRITNYRQGRGVYFDAYSGQDVLVFEEYWSQIPIEELLNILDIYPLVLPARYSDKIALYTKVYITSNVALTEQYKEVQYTRPETWKAFLRRINRVVEYFTDGTTEEQMIF